MTIYEAYENYKTRCEDDDIEPMPMGEFVEDMQEDQFEAERQED